jgi:hypothetical protein
MAALRLKLYSHLFMEEPALPLMPAPLVYVVAGNGVHLWAKRDGLEALIPVQPCAVRDLYPVQPFVGLDGLPRVEARLVQQMLLRGSAARRPEDGTPVETLFFLSGRGSSGWHLWEPSQQQEPTRVAPVREALDMEAYGAVLMEVHTHPLPDMPTFFSCIDDEEERGFRLYGVIGSISRSQGRVEAEIRMRVVIYGVDVASYEFPASWVLSLPEGMRECMAPGTPGAAEEDARWE